MKLTILRFTVLTILTSCYGQPYTQKVNSAKQNEPIAIGDTVRKFSNNIMVIHQDSNNNYWFGSWKDGLYKYDGKAIVHFTTENGLLDNRVEEIKEDKQGNIYINTNKGLYQYNEGHFVKLTEIFYNESDWQLKPDDLWFKCWNNPHHVYRLDGINLYKLKLPKTIIGEDFIQKHPNYPNPYAVYCTYKDTKHNIWFGTAALGVCRYNGESFDWISEQDVTEMHDGPSNGVRSIAEDINGDFWFNTEYRYAIYNQKKSAVINPDNSKFYTRIKSIGSLDGNKDGDLNEYLSIIKDNNNHLWIATYLGGVYRYDGRKISHYPIQVNGKNIPLFCLFKDNKGGIWLGTQENGAYKFNGRIFEPFVF